VSDLPAVSVIVLTYNGEDYLERILTAVDEQEYAGQVETLVIDSGSTDSTLEIVGRFPRVKLVQIPNEEFGHGRTRNLAASLATGEIVAFLTHDAVPDTERWLTELVAPLLGHEEVKAVLGKQVARPLSFPLQRYEIYGMFRSLGPDFGTTLFQASSGEFDQAARDAMSYYSDVNSAVRRDFLLNVIPYQDVRYAEDQLFGKDLIDQGYVKAYAPRASVEHSNDLTLSEYGHRIFDETVGLRQIGHIIPPISALDAFRHSIRGILGDSLRIARDGAYSWRRKAFWLVVNPAYHFKKWYSYRASTLVDIHDHDAVRAGSLEHKRKVRIHLPKA
jgi:rhamnosyltransferase